MQAAAELMLDVGFSGMTTALVAKRAGVSEGTIYRHFKSKEALAEAVFSDFWRLFNAHVDEHLPSRERPLERLEAFFPETLAALSALLPRFGPLVQQEHLYFASKHGQKSVLPDGAKEFVALLEEAVLLAQRAGRVRPEVDPQLAAHFLFSGASHIMEYFGCLHHPQGDCEILPPETARKLQELMFHALY